MFDDIKIERRYRQIKEDAQGRKNGEHDTFYQTVLLKKKTLMFTLEGTGLTRVCETFTHQNHKPSVEPLIALRQARSFPLFTGLCSE